MSSSQSAQLRSASSATNRNSIEPEGLDGDDDAMAACMAAFKRTDVGRIMSGPNLSHVVRDAETQKLRAVVGRFMAAGVNFQKQIMQETCGHGLPRYRIIDNRLSSCRESPHMYRGAFRLSGAGGYEEFIKPFVHEVKGLISASEVFSRNIDEEAKVMSREMHLAKADVTPDESFDKDGRGAKIWRYMSLRDRVAELAQWADNQERFVSEADEVMKYLEF